MVYVRVRVCVRARVCVSARARMGAYECVCMNTCMTVPSCSLDACMQSVARYVCVCTLLYSKGLFNRPKCVLTLTF